MLRNRHTKKEYDPSKPIRKFTTNSPALFSKPTYLQALPEIVDAAPASMRDGIYDYLKKQTAAAGVSDEIKIERAKKFVAISIAGAPLIEAASENSATLDEIKGAYETSRAALKTKLEAEPSFVVELAKTMGSVAFANLLNGYLPGAGLLLAALPAVAATTAADLQVYGGTPSGGMNMCGGNIYCKDAFIAPAGEPAAWLGQVSSTVSTAVGDSMDLAFFDCINAVKIGEAVKSLYVNATGTGLVCFANSPIYHGTQGTAQGTNLPLPDCSKFQQAVAPVFNNCINYSANVGMWIGVAFASVAVLAGLITLTACCCSNSNCCRNR